ncbi:MAG TPA: hypothetical protein VNT53_11010 [Pseudolysinimonas sp.]|nr:hypothetical protein [Pseudolysinimonas sp.]
MGFLDRLFGADDAAPAPAAPRRAPSEDERALARYRYLLQTAPPETIEQVHAEAFAKLTDEQRALIYEELSKGAGTGERPLSSEPATLARAATRTEMRNPGSLQNALAGPSFGSMLGASLLGSVAGYVVGSALVSAFLPWDAAGSDGGNADSGAANADAAGTDSANSDVTGTDAAATDVTGTDSALGDFTSDFGGDFF